MYTSYIYTCMYCVFTLYMDVYIYIYIIYIYIYIADWPIDPNLGLPAESRSTKQWFLRWSAKTPEAKLAKLGNLWQSLSSAQMIVLM